MKILFPFELDNPLYTDCYVYAVKFARNLNAELILLNVFDIELDNNITKEKYNSLVKNNWLCAYNQITRFNKYYIEHHAKTDNDLKIRFDHRYVHGEWLSEIRKILKEETIDLVALPISEDEKQNKKQFKIINDDIFERNNASVLVVPQNCPFKPIGEIVYATDLKKLNYNELYIKDVLSYAKAFDSNIHFIHITKSETAFFPQSIDGYKTIMNAIKKNRKHVFKSFQGKNVIDAIEDYILKSQAGLLVTIKHERFFLDTIFHKSISDELLLKSTIPVLVMREKDDLQDLKI
ncbi:MULTISPECIES: hypothetical protein [unclassified Saccharicrinis]|uniref:hypothetical protein n=1 Tax=unclassified Saccharicrinis TaxID=2646859 RepID=UPI003D3567E6